MIFVFVSCFYAVCCFVIYHQCVFVVCAIFVIYSLYVLMFVELLSEGFFAAVFGVLWSIILFVKLSCILSYCSYLLGLRVVL